MAEVERIKINKIVGICDDSIYVLKEAFKYSDGFKGVGGYSMRPLTREEIDSYNDVNNVMEDYKYLWRDAVMSGSTENSLEGFIDDLINDPNIDGYYFADDPSFRNEFNILISNLPEEQKGLIEFVFGICGDYYLDNGNEEDYVDWTCSSCGRCFSPDMAWQYVFDEDAIKLIKEYEQEEEN